jgi:thermopsin
VTVLMVSGFAFAGLAGALNAGHNSAPAASVSSASKTVSPAKPTGNSAATAPNVAENMAKAAIAATKAAGLKASDVFVPRPSVSPAQVAEAKQQGHIVPSYDGQPAPFGISYFGLGNASNGSVQPSELNTTSVLATANLSNVLPENLVDSSPDGMTIQENAVLSNVTLFGTPGYSFWTQNVIVLFPTVDVLELETNVWNFSGGPLSANVFYAHGPYGTQVGTEYYYASYPLALTPFPVVYPFNLGLWMNSSVVNGRDAMSFTVQLTSSAHPSESFTASDYDYVIFNSIPSAGGAGVSTPSPYTANGYAYNPIGLPDDFELTFGGPGGGSQATLFEADATLGLDYLSNVTDTYQAVPSAFNFGGETGETSTGASITWAQSATGPVATMTTGPGILSGLWNASLPEGSDPVVLTVTPANAFVLVTPVGFNPNFVIPEQAVAPTAFTNTLYLAPGLYNLTLELSGYDPVSLQVTVNGPTAVVEALTPSISAAVYTPLWAFNNLELAALATSGLGTPASPYVLLNNQSAPFSETFGLYNDYSFPAYAGVFIQNTTASAELVNAPSLNTTTNNLQFPGQFLPAYNDLQFWFYNVSNFGLLNTTDISGWFAQTVWYPLVFDTFNVVFYEGGNNLIAGDTFDSTSSQGLLIFSGGGIEAPPFNIGGQNYTVWGNVFETASGPAPNANCTAIDNATDPCNLMSPVLGLGLELAGGNDTVYNNEFLSVSTAWQPPENLYSGFPELFTDTWNITPVPGSTVNYAAGFPNYPLSGNILGPSATVNGALRTRGYQGGNYWWDYGLPYNPYNGAYDQWGSLPYDENGLTPYGFGPYIFNGGDYAPIVPYYMWTITFSETGLPSGTPWDVQILGPGDGPGGLTEQVMSTGTTAAVLLPEGYYGFNISAPLGYVATPSSSSFLTVFNDNGQVSIVFSKTSYDVTVSETGLSGKSLAKGWTAVLGGVVHKDITSTSTTFSGVYNGSYPYLISGPAGYILDGAVGPAGTLVVNGGNRSLSVSFEPGKTVTLSFSEKGLAKGQSWCVEVQSEPSCSAKASQSFTDLSAGSYSWSVVSPTSGQTITPESSGTVSLTKSTTVALKFAYDYSVTFSETGLASGNWAITLGGVTKTAAAGTSIVFEETNATYGYKIGAVSGFTSSGSPKKAVVDGADTSVAVTFTAKP